MLTLFQVTSTELVVVSQQTNSGRVRDQPGLPVHEGSYCSAA